jgi:hypothetical protein
VPKPPRPNGPPHGGIDFKRSTPEPDPKRQTYVEAQALVPGDIVLVRNVIKARAAGRREVENIFEEDRIIVMLSRRSDGKVVCFFEPKRDRENQCCVEPTHRFVAVKVAHPIVPKGKRT